MAIQRGGGGSLRQEKNDLSRTKNGHLSETPSVPPL